MTEQERRGWSVVACMCAVLLVLYGGCLLSFGVFVTPLVKQFGWSRTRVSMLMTVMSLAMAFTQPFVGWLIDRIESWMVMTVGELLLVLGLVLSSRANSFGEMTAGYTLIGLGLSAATLVPAFAVTANWFEEGQRGFALGVVGTGPALGGMVMPLVANRAVYALGWRAAYLVIAVPVVVIILPWVIVSIRNRPAARGAAHGGQPPALEGVELEEAIRGRSFWLIMLGYFLFTFTLTMVVAHLIPFLLGLGYQRGVATWAYSAMQGAAIVGSLIIGRIGDRIGGRFTVAICFTIAALGLALLRGASQGIAVVLFVICYGLSFVAPASMLPLLLCETVGLKRFGLFSGLGNLMVSMGAALGPLLAGRVFDATGGYTAVFEMAAGFALLGTLGMLAVPASATTFRGAAAH